jgi:hypothetical protein
MAQRPGGVRENRRKKTRLELTSWKLVSGLTGIAHNFHVLVSDGMEMLVLLVDLLLLT